MRGVETRIQEIRHRIFREVARMAYHTEWPVDKRIEELPYKIIPGEVGNFRNDVFLERAIVGERLRLAMGLPCRNASDQCYQICLQRLQREESPCNRRMSGMFSSSLRRSLSKGSCYPGSYYRTLPY